MNPLRPLRIILTFSVLLVLFCCSAALQDPGQSSYPIRNTTEVRRASTRRSTHSVATHVSETHATTSPTPTSQNAFGTIATTSPISVSTGTSVTTIFVGGGAGTSSSTSTHTVTVTGRPNGSLQSKPFDARVTCILLLSTICYLAV